MSTTMNRVTAGLAGVAAGAAAMAGVALASPSQAATQAPTQTVSTQWQHGPLPSWLAWRHVRHYDGHRNCVIVIGGDTAVITCRDGFAETS